ncbi:hypothetical protein HWC62_gp89 [Pseudomonas phage PA8P1]|uniref:Uncharacterized protein n=1 Tax=Pseudomonas phage PA8P1 TaxID=2848039 RepID=A0A5C1KA28_9CAUD|nr:hypothetical protein HWC62_gp89 [Pseudomonas phage PA8P1]QEM42872.1 hypothetical protein PA8P1_088 [Pseudomonas phage PA8P1]
MADLENPGVPKFEKINSNKLYEALETIAELEKKRDESEKRTRELAEVERPEVVGYRSAASRMVYEKDCGLQNPEPMMLVSQHDRIVEELLNALASTTEARNRYNNLWNCAGNRLALAQVEIRKVTSERYAALARVAELEAALSSALSQHGIKFMDPPDGGDTPLIEQVCRMSQALAELEKQESVAWVEVIDRDYGPYKFYGKRLLPKGKYQLYAAPVAQALHSVPEASEQEKEQGWTLDYRFVERVTDLAASRTEYTTSMEATEQVLLAARELLAAAPAQAQHSVPEVSGIGRDFAYPRSVVLYLRTEPTDDDLRAIHDGLRSLAAAPGKESV